MFFSVITVCLNAQDVIQKTLESVYEQTFDDFEYLIIDGNSKDETLKIIQKYEDKFRGRGIRLRILSERDNGIYNAMNKGLHLAEGEWVNYMNAGDTFFDNKTLGLVFSSLIDHEADVAYGMCKCCIDGCEEIRQVHSIEMLQYSMIFSHQAAFVRRGVLRKYSFNEKYKIAADYDSFLRMYINKCQFLYIDETIAVYDNTGVSAISTSKTFKEMYQVRKDNHIVDDCLNDRLLLFRGYYRRKIYDEMLPEKFRKWWKKKSDKKHTLPRVD